MRLIPKRDQYGTQRKKLFIGQLVNFFLEWGIVDDHVREFDEKEIVATKVKP